MDRGAPVTGLVLSCLAVATCLTPAVAQGKGIPVYTLRINGARGATLRVRTSTRQVLGTARVHTQVTQSRRRR